MKDSKYLRFLIPVLILLITSCRTLPIGPFPDIIDWLPVESDLILRMEVPGNEDLLDILITNAGLDPTKLEKVVDRTALVAVGLELDSSGENVSIDSLPIHIASIGVWPKGLLGGALGKDWKKSGLGRYRWSGPGGLELTALSNEEVLLSRGRTDQMLERLRAGSKNPRLQRAIDLKIGAELALWITDPDIVLKMVPMLPARNSDGTAVVEMIGLALRRLDDGDFAMYLNIYPSDSRLSGSIALALRFGLSARFGMSPDPDERALLSDMVVEIGTGEVKLILPSMEMDMLVGFLNDLSFFPEEAQ